jgi:hypothetical protein
MNEMFTQSRNKGHSSEWIEYGVVNIGCHCPQRPNGGTSCRRGG